MNAGNCKKPTRAALAVRATVALTLLTSLAALPPGRYVGIERGGTTGLQLELPGIQDAVYEIHAKSNLTQAAWQPIGTVTGTLGTATVPVNVTDDDTQFLRVKFPQPTVSAGEPALYAQGAGGSSLYVTGQFFYPGDQIWVQGVALQNVVFLSHNLLRGDLPPLPPGRYAVQVRSAQGGALLAELPDALHVVDPVATPDSLLQGPPEAALASPTGLWLSKKGYDYYKAVSDRAASASPETDALVKSYLEKKLNKAAYVGPPDNGKGITERGIKLFDDASTMSAGFEVVEGKKGLNAVNVKRTYSTSGIGSTGQDGIEVSLPSRRRGGNLGSVGEDGVSLFSGDVQACVVDLAVPGRGLDFVWGRTYHSRLGRTSSATNGWTFSYDLHLQPLGGDLLLHSGNGRADRYVLQTNGVYTCPEFFSEGTLSSGTFRLTFADTGYWEFKPLGTAPDAGKLDRIVDRNGNTVSLSYDTAGRLSEIVDTLGRACTVAYDTAGRLASVSDFAGRTVSYLYDANGDLVACVSPPVTGTPTGNDFPTGKTNRYVYTSGSSVEAENHLLLACVDGRDETTTQYGYDLNPASPSYLRCTSVQRGTHPPMMVTYQALTPSPDNRFAAQRCIVNDPVGNVNELLYDCRGRGIEKAQIKRRAEPGQPVTDTAALPYDKLRPDDPDSTVTRWSWNNDSLCTSATAPGGQVVSYTYQGDLEPSTPARKRADCRVVRELAVSAVDLDGDGTPDTSERAWRFEYDPRFGSDPTPRYGKKIYVGNLPFSAARADCSSMLPDTAQQTRAEAAVSDKFAQVRGFKVEIAGFITSATDPRGGVTATVHDDKGNPTNKAVVAHSGYLLDGAGAPVQRFTYDVHGQPTAITRPSDANSYSRVDTFAWSQGQLTECVVDTGVGGLAITTSFEYDERGNLTRCVDPRTNDWLFTYNSLDQCVRVQTPTNISARTSTGFLYDANDNLVRCVTQVRDEADVLLGTRTDRASYDALHRLTEVALAVDATHALTNRFVYDGNDRCVQVLGGDAVSGVDPNHAVVFEYDTCGLLYREIAAPGSADQCTTQYDYDTNGLLTRVSEGLEETPSVTTLAYDGFAGCSASNRDFQRPDKVIMRSSTAPLQSVCDNPAPLLGAKAKAWMVNNLARVSQITDSMGNVATFHHDANDNVTVARQFGQMIDMPGSDGNLRLAESRFEYDALDRCVTQRELHFDPATQSPVGDGECTTAFAYAPNGACTGVTNDLGEVTTASYDTAGRVQAVASASGGYQRIFVKNKAGRITAVTQTDSPGLGGPPQSFTRTFAYDSLDRCVSTTDGVGKTSACAYDSLGRVVRATDAAGTATFRSYDLLGRCTLTVLDLDGDNLPDIVNDITEQATWSSSSDRLLATTDSHGNTASYAYDSRDRCVAVTCADGTQEQLVWSPRSNVMREIDPNGSVITNSYDLSNRLVGREIVANEAAGVSAATTFETFTYDGCDRLVGHRDDDCDGDFTYDSLGRCVSETLNGLATTSTYDALGNRLSLTHPSGRSLAYAYDARGCTNLTESGVSLASFRYDGSDRLVRVTYGNGLMTTYEYDGLDGVQNEPGDHGFGQVSQWVHASTNGTPVKTSHLSWDLKENKGARVAPPLGTGGSTNVLVLEYDRADRLVRSTVTDGPTTLRDTIYGLDRMGNRTNVTGAACSGPYALDPASPPADSQMNQYSSTPCDTRTYDANGNLVSRSSLSDGALTVYRYDAADRLVVVQRVVDGGTAGLVTNDVASYTYDVLGRRVSKTVYADGLPPSTRLYCYDGACVIEEREDNVVAASYTLMHGDGSILRLSRSGAHYFVLADDQGNAVALTDESGAVVEGYDYDDYGGVTFLASDGTPTSATSSAFGLLYCWGGMRLDSETGLHNDDGGGYFEPQVGRPKSRRAKKKFILPDPKFDPLSNNSPWSGGTPLGMQKGTVKFFNETKGFGRAAPGDICPGGQRSWPHAGFLARPPRIVVRPGSIVIAQTSLDR